ncbi:hypothetical protein [Rhizobium rhizogenes]|jgi:hypothetical protein|nr:hypothetical protein [Rhizobium rhizogenes]MDJ1632703.1 hypothetical protein [Rhizobium rhizogenes]
MARVLTMAGGKLLQAKRNGFVALFLIILINDLLAAAAVAYVFGFGG